VSRQKVEYIITCVMIVHGFYTAYYNSSMYRAELDKDQKLRDPSKVGIFSGISFARPLLNPVIRTHVSCVITV
jgi:hypothetical protein